MRNKNFVRKKQAIYISPNKKSTRIIKTLMDFSLFIKIKIKMVCFSVPSGRTMSGGHRYCADQSGSGDTKKRTSEDDKRFAQSFEKLVLLAQAKEGDQNGAV